MDESIQRHAPSRLLALSPVLSFLSIVCFQMYGISHWHHLRESVTLVTRCSDLLPVDAWKGISVALALAGFAFAFARRSSGLGVILKIFALVLAALACLTIPILT
jgi:hypothetical protein